MMRGLKTKTTTRKLRMMKMKRCSHLLKMKAKLRGRVGNSLLSLG
jgi:hypothetical protein